jgi:POT family proton-dependent oligopeptide transporter
VELWERFSYYGMRALLIFYLTRHFLFSDSEAYGIYAAYAGLVYAMPVIAGAIADRWLGARKAVAFGALLLCAGHLSLAIEGPSAIAMTTGEVSRSTFHVDLFLFSLALIVTGVGFLKTSASTLVGSLYPRGDNRRDAGYTLFYMGANLGAAVAPLLCGWLGETFGWRYGFGAAGVGMLAGLAVFIRGQHRLQGAAEPPDPAALRARSPVGISWEMTIYAATLLLVVGAWLALRQQFIVGGLLAVLTAGVSAFVIMYALRHCDAEARRSLLGCAILIAFSLGFWSFYEQMGSSMNLFADRLVDRRYFGVEIPATMLQSLPAIFVITLSPLLSMLWLYLGARGREPGTPAKFVMALTMLAVSFWILSWGTQSTPEGEKIALGWFVATFLFMVIGELCLAPVALSMISSLSPERIVGVMMGSFSLAYAASSYLSGFIARLAPSVTELAREVDLATAYAEFFATLGTGAFAVALLLAASGPFIKRLLPAG